MSACHAQYYDRETIEVHSATSVEAPPGPGRCPSVSTGHQRRPKTMTDVTNDSRENSPDPVPSRRSFLTRAAGASAAALPALALLHSSRVNAGQPKKLTG